MESASMSSYSEVAVLNDLNAKLKELSDLNAKLKELNDLNSKLKELNDLNEVLKIADSVKLPLISRCCIYKVPPKLRKVNNEGYTPSVVSIGPYHLGNKRLKSMQELKVWYVNRFLGRNPEKSLQDYLKSLKDQENDIRGCYSETIQLQNDEFVRMIFTDACFIIEFFLARAGLVLDPLVAKLWPTSDIQLDLILLENQLPFFVLTHIFDMSFPSGFNGELSFDELTFDVFVKIFFQQIYPKTGTQENNSFRKSAFDAFVNVFSLRICSKRETDHHRNEEIDHSRNEESHPRFMRNFNHNSLGEAKHLCDVLRRFYLPTDTPPRESDPAKTCSQSASQLHEAGMKFQADIESGVTKVEYSEKVLKIPRIVVSDWTETMLRNVIALEQCHYPDSGYVTDYACLLDDLIDTEKDVKILVEEKIMEDLLSDSNRVVSMVNKLGMNVVVTDTNKDYNELLQKMDEFCDKPWHKYKAIFKREYWSTPWKIASVIAATLLLVLTFIQTISSVT